MSADATSHVFRHSPYSGATFAVLQAIADSVNDQHENKFWMSVGRLCQKARYGRRAVQMALRTLVDEGWLEPIGSEDGETRRYRFVFDDDRPVIYETRTQGGAKSAPLALAAPVQIAAEGGADRDIAPPQNLRPNPKKQTQEEPKLSAFDRFWAVYPRRAGKEDARRAFKSSVVAKKVNPADVIAGAVRYRDDPNRVDKFTKLPASWLRAGRWEDDPLPADDTAHTNGSRPSEPSPPAYPVFDGSYVRQDPDTYVDEHGRLIVR